MKPLLFSLMLAVAGAAGAADGGQLSGKRSCPFRGLNSEAEKSGMDAVVRGEVFSVALRRLSTDSRAAELLCNMSRCTKGMLRDMYPFAFGGISTERIKNLEERLTQDVQFESYGVAYLDGSGRTANVGFERENKVDASLILGKSSSSALRDGVLTESLDTRFVPTHKKDGLTEFDYIIKLRYDLYTPLRIRPKSAAIRLFQGQAALRSDESFVFVSQGLETQGLKEPTYLVVMKRLKNEKGKGCGDD